MTLRLLAAVLLALLLALPAGAQSVSGHFVDADGTPIPSARVVLQDEAGRVVHAAMTDASGRFSLRAPAAGRYVLRGERIGYATSLSPPLLLAAGEQASHRLVAASGRVLLDAVVVSAQAQCAPRPGDSGQTATVWREVRKALDAVSATRDQLSQFAVELFEREVHGTVALENRRRVEGMAHQPFVPVDPERLATVGFVERDGEAVLYAAPDADVLLSDRFLEEHCFQLRTAGAPVPGLIGLAFEPVRGRRVPDVQGVLWNLNSFDQFGVQLGKQACERVLQAMERGDFGSDDRRLDARHERQDVVGEADEEPPRQREDDVVRERGAGDEESAGDAVGGDETVPPSGAGCPLAVPVVGDAVHLHGG